MQDVNEIKAELFALRSQIGRISGGLGGTLRASSSWSAHANWKSSSKLIGDFDIQSTLSLPEGVGTPTEFVKLMGDASSENLLEVAKSLTSLMADKTK